MRNIILPLALACVFAPALLPLRAAETADIMLVDGTVLKAEYLFKHPNAPLFIIRSLRQSGLQSLREDHVHAIRIGGNVKTFAPRREWTERESLEARANGLWADLPEEGRINKFANQTWERKAVAVWAHPGKSGNAFEPSNWLDENGEPYQKNIFQKNEGGKDEYGRPRESSPTFDGDILAPQADTKYTIIQEGERDHLREHMLRHITVEANAVYRVAWQIWGNIWVKAGGSLYDNVQTGHIGNGDNRHVVARFGQVDFDGEPNWVHADCIAHWVWIDLGDEGSLEVVGLSRGPTDRIELRTGTLIVSRDSYIGNGNRATYHGAKGTTTILLDGAKIGSPFPITSGSGGRTMGTYSFAGRIMFGTPELPLTRDLIMGMCYYHKENITPNISASTRGSGASLVLAESGEMVVHSSNPQKARVVFRPLPKTFPIIQYALPRDLWDTLKNNQEALWRDTRVPQGISMVLHGKTDFDGVVFDGFYPQSILVRPGAHRAWRNVSFGEANLAPPAELIREME